MTQPRLRDLVKASNPVVTQTLLPDERDVRTLYAEAMQRAGNPQTSVDLLEHPVERRRDMQTQEKPIEIVREKKASRPRRPLIPALAGAMAVIVIAVGAWALTRSSELDVADLLPLEVMEIVFNENVVTGDHADGHLYFTSDATYQLLLTRGEGPVFRLADDWPDPSPIPDWDGDGKLTVMDGFIGLGAEVSAGGTTTLLSCAQSDAAIVLCDEIREGFAFKNPDHIANWTVTFVDGLIDSIVIEVGPVDGTDPNALRSYTGWVRANYPNEAGDLVNEFSGVWKLTPETIERHRELVAEWVAQR